MKLRQSAFIAFLAIASAQAQSPKEVHIGIASNFSEPSSSSSNPYGDYFRNGVKLAIEDSKAKLSKAGINITLDEFDYGTTQVKVLDAARKAAASNVIGVLGYNFSSHALLAAPIHQEAKLPMLTPSATADRIGKFGKFVHMGCFDNSFMGNTLAKIAWNRLKVKKAAIVVAADCAYCMDLAKAFQTEFQSIGGEIVLRNEVLESDQDFTAVTDALKKAPTGSYDAILVPNQELNSARIISAILKAGIQKPFLGGDGWGNVGEEFFGVIGKANVNGYSVSHWHEDLKTPRSQKFVKDFKARFNKTPNDTAVLAYDGMLLMIGAILKAKELTRPGLEASLLSLKTFDGVTGHAKFRPGNSPLKSLTLISANNGKFAPIAVIDPTTSTSKKYSEAK